jgi:hypothetical protein
MHRIHPFLLLGAFLALMIGGFFGKSGRPMNAGTKAESLLHP